MDATHPYAIEVTENLQSACEKPEFHIEDLRIQELKSQIASMWIAWKRQLNIWSRRQEIFWQRQEVKNWQLFRISQITKKRVYARVLSTAKVAHKCEQLGFTGKNLLCMQGPFSVEMNYAIMKSYDISYMVTKDSGNIGGFLQKYNAAKKAGVKSSFWPSERRVRIYL